MEGLIIKVQIKFQEIALTAKKQVIWQGTVKVDQIIIEVIIIIIEKIIITVVFKEIVITVEKQDIWLVTVEAGEIIIGTTIIIMVEEEIITTTKITTEIVPSL